MRFSILVVLFAACYAQSVPNAVPMPTPEIQYLNAQGKPLAGAKLCTYAAGTTTPLATYTDSTAGTPNTNPIILDVNGRASVWIGPQLYKFVLRVGGDNTCSTGAVQWTQDNVSDTTLYFVNYVKTIGTANLLTYTNPASGAVTRNVNDRLADNFQAKDFNVKCDGSTDDTTAIQNAINSAQGVAKAAAIHFPSGTCVISSALNLTGGSGVWLIGYGWGENTTGDGGTVLKQTGTTASIIIGNTSSDQTADIRILGLRLQGTASSGDGIQVNRVHNMLIEGNRIWSMGGNGITFYHAYGNKVIRNYINNNSGSGFVANEMDDHTVIEDNNFLANTAKGIWFNNGSSAGTKILKNDIEGNDVGVEIDAGNPADQAEAYVIAFNYFEGQHHNNISLGTDGSTTRFLYNPVVFANHVNPGTADAATNAFAMDRVINPVVTGNTFDFCNMTVTSATVGGVTYGNSWTGSTYPTGIWAALDLNNLNPSGTQNLGRMGGLGPMIEQRSSGWGQSSRAGNPTWQGNVFELSNNVRSISATQGNLDDITSAGTLLRLTNNNIDFYQALPGTNPRTFTHLWDMDLSGDVTMYGNLILSAQLLKMGNGVASLPQLDFLNAGHVDHVHVGMLISGDEYDVGVNINPISTTQGNLDDTGSPGVLWRLKSDGMYVYYSAAGSNPVTMNETQSFGISGGLASQFLAPVTFAQLGSLPGRQGQIAPCTNCQYNAGACGSGGTGALAIFMNGLWRCLNLF